MSKKDFKMARKPGRGGTADSVATLGPAHKTRPRRASSATIAAVAGIGVTTRKTIEVPEDYFRQVKIRAVERGMLEKELWAEILSEYFRNHPTA